MERQEYNSEDTKDVIITDKNLHKNKNKQAKSLLVKTFQQKKKGFKMWICCCFNGS